MPTAINYTVKVFKIQLPAFIANNLGAPIHIFVGECLFYSEKQCMYTLDNHSVMFCYTMDSR